jgi:hypothetical protein
VQPLGATVFRKSSRVSTPSSASACRPFPSWRPASGHPYGSSLLPASLGQQCGGGQVGARELAPSRRQCPGGRWARYRWRARARARASQVRAAGVCIGSAAVCCSGLQGVLEGERAVVCRRQLVAPPPPGGRQTGARAAGASIDCPVYAGIKPTFQQGLPFVTSVPLLSQTA